MMGSHYHYLVWKVPSHTLDPTPSMTHRDEGSLLSKLPAGPFLLPQVPVSVKMHTYLHKQYIKDNIFPFTGTNAKFQS